MILAGLKQGVQDLLGPRGYFDWPQDLGPDGFHAPLKMGKVAAGHYRGRLGIGQNQGLFRVRPQIGRAHV